MLRACRAKVLWQTTERYELRSPELVWKRIWPSRPRGCYVLASCLVICTVLLVAACACMFAQSDATGASTSDAVLRLYLKRPGDEFGAGAVGLSTETRELSTGRLSARHASLVRLMRLLGPSVLRIGGNSVDASWWSSTGEPPPSWASATVTPADLSALGGLLTQTGWRVLLGVDLGHFDPSRAASEARDAREILGAKLMGVEVGNEPDAFGDEEVDLRASSYSVGEYLREAEAYRRAIRESAPGVAIYGPATARTGWLTGIGAAAHMFSGITQHYYPTSTCPSAPASRPEPTAGGLLSLAVRQNENEVLAALAQAGTVAGRSARIGETNGVACTSSPSASPTLASALWAFDWALRASASGVTGLNFHGELGVCNPYSPSPICVPSAVRSRATEVTAQPEYYGLLAASRLEGGRFVPAHLAAPEPLPNITTWATLASDGSVTIAIDDLATSGVAQPVSIPTSGYRTTEEILAAPSAEAKSGVTFGNASVTSAGVWRPVPERSRRHRVLDLIVRPASAVIVSLRREGREGRRRPGG